MKKLVYILLVVVMACGVACCNRYGETEARLVAIDSLVCDQPDSALSLLADINGDSLPTDLQAYHSLLTVQALYKAYIPATSDTLIRCAWDYYRDHGPYDRRIRAMLYMGTVAEELGHPDSAMRWYKKCESKISTNDYYNLGYIHLRMAYLYQFQYVAPEKAVFLHKKSYHEFKKCDNSFYQLICLTELGMVYRLINGDSALYYSNKAIKQSISLNNKTQLLKNYESLAGYYLECKDWDNALYCAMEVIKSGEADNHNACYYFAALSYIQKSKQDSAWHYFKLAPPPKSIQDSVLYNRTLSDLLYKEGKYKESALYADKAGEISGNAVIKQSKIDYSKIEKEFENSLLENDNKKLSFHLKWLWGLIGFIVLVFVASFYYAFNEYKKFKHRLLIDKEKISKANNEIRTLSEKLINQQSDIRENIQGNERFKEIVDVQSSCMKLLFNSTVYSGLKGSSIFKYIFDIQKTKNKMLVKIKLPDKFWTELNQYADLAFPNAFKNIEQDGVVLTEKEKKLILLDCLHVPNAVMSIILDYAEFSTASMRNRLLSKLGRNGATIYQIMHDKSDK